MIKSCPVCGKRVGKNENSSIYLYAKNEQTGLKEEVIIPMHDRCYDQIKDNVQVAGTEPKDNLVEEDAIILE